MKDSDVIATHVFLLLCVCLYNIHSVKVHLFFFTEANITKARKRRLERENRITTQRMILSVAVDCEKYIRGQDRCREANTTT